ncbi:MAG: hypothetical protein ACYTGP_03640 [Planctomycetota bacterium]
MDDLPPQAPEPLEPEETTWPRAIGVISIIYAVGGMLCQVVVSGWTMLSEQLMAMGGMDFDIPPSLRYPTLVFSFFAFCLGVYMLTGATSLLKRRRVGVARLKRWAVLRLVLLVLGLGSTLFTLPGQIDLQRQVLEFQNQQLRESGREDLVKPFDEDAAWFQVIVSTGIFTGVFAVYPLFVGFFLSRRKITDELETWM